MKIDVRNVFRRWPESISMNKMVQKIFGAKKTMFWMVVDVRDVFRRWPDSIWYVVLSIWYLSI